MTTKLLTTLKEPKKCWLSLEVAVAWKNWRHVFPTGSAVDCDNLMHECTKLKSRNLCKSAAAFENARIEVKVGCRQRQRQRQEEQELKRELKRS